MQILDEYGNHKALFHVEEMRRGASKYKQAMLILLFREPQCWLLNWSICQKLHKILCPKPGGKHCPYCKPFAWQLWPWISNLVFMWVISTPVSGFTDSSATACAQMHCRRVLSYWLGWLPRLTGSSTSFMLKLHPLWPCVKLGSWPLQSISQEQPQLSSLQTFLGGTPLCCLTSFQLLTGCAAYSKKFWQLCVHPFDLHFAILLPRSQGWCTLMLGREAYSGLGAGYTQLHSSGRES